jgi:hypothetical protein
LEPYKGILHSSHNRRADRILEATLGHYPIDFEHGVANAAH